MPKLLHRLRNKDKWCSRKIRYACSEGVPDSHFAGYHARPCESEMPLSSTQQTVRDGISRLPTYPTYNTLAEDEEKLDPPLAK